MRIEYNARNLATGEAPLKAWYEAIETAQSVERLEEIRIASQERFE